MNSFIGETGLAKDLPLINTYVKEYGAYGAMPMDKYLEDWYEAKSQYLLRIFKNKLIHEIPVSLTIDQATLDYNMGEYLANSDVFSDVQYGIIQMMNEVLLKGKPRWSNSLFSQSPEVVFYDFVRDILFLETKVFTTNSIQVGKTLSVHPSENNYLDRTISIQNGQKPFRCFHNLIKALEPICRERFPDEFPDSFFESLNRNLENARIIHSQVLNTTKISGTLCFSIHPLDYITMSDNGYGWDSCMTWTREDEPGEYRAGTLEMMNSPSVVVAYINGTESWHPCYRLDTPWSNKKWRELFIIDKDFITGIRAYPYRSDELDQICLRNLADMVEKAGFSSYERDVHKTGNDKTLRVNEESWYSFATTLMYNDYSCHTCNYIVAKKPEHKVGLSVFNYSGTARCLCCGAIMDNHDDAEFVICDDCGDRHRCVNCGSIIRDDYGELINGEWYCPDCSAHCEYCDEPYPWDEEGRENLVTAFIKYAGGHISRERAHFCPHCFEKYKPYLMEEVDANRVNQVLTAYGSILYNVLVPTQEFLNSDLNIFNKHNPIMDLRPFLDSEDYDLYPDSRASP